MTPRDLLTQLKAEGVDASLKLRLEGDMAPSTETLNLLTRHRDDLIIYLASRFGDTPEMCRLSERVTEGSVWCKRCYRYQLRACVPSEKRLGRSDSTWSGKLRGF